MRSDHFERDRQEYGARALVTRKQFGMMLAVGVAMMLRSGKSSCRLASRRRSVGQVLTE